MNVKHSLQIFDRKIMGRVLLIMGLIAAVVVPFYIVRNASLPSIPRVSAGQLDLADWDFEKDGNLSLNGEWGFYWNQLIDGTDDNSRELPDAYVRVPDVWTNYTVNGSKLPGFGYATYTLKLYGLDGIMAMRMDHCATSYELYIDGKLAAQNGTIGKSSKEAVPYYESKTIIFRPEKEETILTLYISNYTYARGGLWYPVQLGRPDAIGDLNNSIADRRSFILGSVITLMILCVYAFLLGIRKPSLYYFVFMSLCSVIVVLVYGDYMLVKIFESFRAAIVLEYLSITLFPMFIALFLQSLLQNSGSLMRKMIPAVSISLFVFTLVTPIYIFTQLIVLMEIWAVIITLYLLYCIAKSDKKYKYSLFLGTVIMTAGGIVDFLYQACIIPVGNIASVGFLLMLLIFGFPLLQYYILVERERTSVLEQSKNAEIRFLSAQIKPHFLYNSLNAVANVSEKDGMKGSQLILDLAVFLRKKLEFTDLNRKASLGMELDFVEKYFEIEKARFGDKIKLELQINAPLACEVPILVLQPLVENSVRHGISKKLTGGTVWVRATALGKNLCIEVQDDGIGIEPERRKVLLVQGDAGAGVAL
ncbi:MAG: hypothetical protein K0Q48_1662 [Bacillota bacterium]|jgi:sensor histidine kinase YesM|nr:hypothetical protein [Bacillota bacterium]